MCEAVSAFAPVFLKLSKTRGQIIVEVYKVNCKVDTTLGWEDKTLWSILYMIIPEKNLKPRSSINQSLWSGEYSILLNSEKIKKPVVTGAVKNFKQIPTLSEKDITSRIGGNNSKKIKIKFLL